MVEFVYLAAILNFLFIILKFALLVLLILALLKYVMGEKGKKENIESIQSLGQRIKEYRIKNNMTQEFVAQSLHVSRQAVSKWEQGTGYPEVEKLLLLSSKLSVSLDSLMETEIAKNSNTQKQNVTGTITIISSIERVIATCHKVVSS